MVLALMVPLLLIAAGMWLWMARANRGGRSWARITSTVFFGVLTAGELAWLITFLTRKINLAAIYIGVDVSLCFAYWLVALSAVVLLWRRSSSDYYIAVGNQLKANRVASRKPHDQTTARPVADPDPN